MVILLIVGWFLLLNQAPPSLDGTLRGALLYLFENWFCLQMLIMLGGFAFTYVLIARESQPRS